MIVDRTYPIFIVLWFVFLVAVADVAHNFWRCLNEHLVSLSV